MYVYLQRKGSSLDTFPFSQTITETKHEPEKCTRSRKTKPTESHEKDSCFGYFSPQCWNFRIR